MQRFTDMNMQDKRLGKIFMSPVPRDLADVEKIHALELDKQDLKADLWYLQYSIKSHCSAMIGMIIVACIYVTILTTEIAKYEQELFPCLLIAIGFCFSFSLVIVEILRRSSKKVEARYKESKNGFK